MITPSLDLSALRAAKAEAAMFDASSLPRVEEVGMLEALRAMVVFAHALATPHQQEISDGAPGIL